MLNTESLIGRELTCAETGKRFVGAVDGCTTNYARDAQGNVYSDEGVDIRERRELLDRTRPFYCYVSSDGRHATGWKGNELGRVTRSTPTRIRTVFAGCLTSYRVRDCHGGEWYGRGAPGMCITLRACKA